MTEVLRDLENKSALVTGATSGIGKAAALQLAAQGAHVIVHGRDEERGKAVVDLIEENGGTARFVAADLADPAAAQQLGQDVGDVDILVNNAGFSWFGPTADLDLQTLSGLFAANVEAAYVLVAALAPKMAARGDGVIINLSSMAGTVGLAGGAAYGATKAALASLARSWAAEYGPAGVRWSRRCPDHLPGRDDAARTSRAARRDRRSDRVPRLSPRWLRDGRPHPRRRGTHRRLRRTSSIRSNHHDHRRTRRQFRRTQRR
jgi:NAD(P)-dependent dehydrogenase (short-subunit alcohol dehydrogenase family)